MAKYGKVYLVGAGPGDPELISIKGLRLLREANVVVYDRLVHPGLLDYLSETTERIFVGKAPGKKVLPQESIQVLLVERALQGDCIVRLKGGDPFVFGRGGEECLALAHAGIPFEVVPGVSSAFGIPAYAGIPLTHRGISRGFSVVTGYTKEDYGIEPDWPGLAHQGTLVVLMGLRTLPRIVDSLLGGGIERTLPAAVISHGATPCQETVKGSVETIVSLAAHMSPPAIVVFGDVVRLSEEISWADPMQFTGTTPFTEIPPFLNVSQLTNRDRPVHVS